MAGIAGSIDGRRTFSGGGAVPDEEVDGIEDGGALADDRSCGTVAEVMVGWYGRREELAKVEDSKG
jgi:hypothetical protein